MVQQLSLLQPERPLPRGAAHELRQRCQLEVVERVQLQLQGNHDEGAAHLGGRGPQPDPTPPRAPCLRPPQTPLSPQHTCSPTAPLLNKTCLPSPFSLIKGSEPSCPTASPEEGSRVKTVCFLADILQFSFASSNISCFEYFSQSPSTAGAVVESGRVREPI